MFLRLITDKALKKLIEKEVKTNDEKWNRFIDNTVMQEVKKVFNMGIEEGQNRMTQDIKALKNIIRDYSKTFDEYIKTN